MKRNRILQVATYAGHIQRYRMQAVMFSLALVVSLCSGLAFASETVTKSHGYSYFGGMKYDADFKHLDYVNPDAPKGGEISTHGALARLILMNPYSRKGRAGVNVGSV